MHRFTRLAPVAASTLVLAGLCLSGCQRASGEDDTPGAGAGGAAPVSVSVTPAVARMRAEGREAAGTVQAMTTALVSSRVLAPITAVHVTAGTRVRAGQRLVTLDDRDLAAAAEQTRSGVTAAEHAVRAAEAEQAASDAAAVQARASLDRVRRLHEAASATAQELDDATAASRLAAARVEAAGARAAQARATLDAARASERGSLVVAGYAQVVAPFDGLVTETLVEAGNMATPGSPLVRLESLDGLRVDVRVDESWVRDVLPGAVVPVEIGTAADVRRVEGRVMEVARAADADARAVLVKVRIDTAGMDAPPPSGRFARVLLPGSVRQGLFVPGAAVVRRGQVATIFVVEGDRARVRLLQVGRASGELIEVRAGLDAGERVVVAPPPGLRDGAAVVTAAGAAITVAEPAGEGRRD